MSNDVTLNDKRLKDLIKAFSGEMPVARIGVLGANTDRNALGPNNAEIGAAHEYGTSVLPQRSFLRVPVSEHLQEFMQSAGAFNKKSIDKVIRDKSIHGWVEKMAVTAVAVVREAFQTGGFGKWQPSNMRRKKVKQTLVETTQLRESISWDIK